jgi:hypothetical protein
MNMEMANNQMDWRKAWEPFVSGIEQPLIERIENIVKGKGRTIDETHKVRLLELEELLFVWTYTLNAEDDQWRVGPIHYLWEPLFYSNANDPGLYKWLEGEVKQYLDHWHVEATQYNKTLQLLEWAESIPVLHKRGLCIGPSLKEKLIHFLLTREITLRYSIDPDGGRRPKRKKLPLDEKLIMKTNSTTLLLLFRALNETQWIAPVTDSELCRFIAAYFGTERQRVLSVESLRNKYRFINKDDVLELKSKFKEGCDYLDKVLADKFK